MAKKGRPEGAQEVAERTAHQVVQREIKAIFHRGPLPSPESMAKYEQLWPGATEFFFAQLEKQSSHRQDLEKSVVTNNIKSTNRGQWMAFVLFLLVTLLGFGAIVLGHDINGTIIALAGLAAQLALFFMRRRASDQQLASKDQ